MMLAEGPFANLFDHVLDHAWPGWSVEIGPLHVTLMSSGIATMLIVGTFLGVVLPLLARRQTPLGADEKAPHGGHNLVEALVVFVRDMIAAPALGSHKDRFLPLLLTLFVFVLGLNLMGLVLPLEPLTRVLTSRLGLHGVAVGGPTTSVPMICATLASISLLAIVVGGLREAAQRTHHQKHWPLWVCYAVSPVLWVAGLSPEIPGPIGRVLILPLALLELVGALVKCVALMIRLFANMVSGHLIIALLLALALMVLTASLDTQQGNMGLIGVSILPILGGVLICVLELLVAFLQAYIFTFLTAIYLGLYAGGKH